MSLRLSSIGALVLLVACGSNPSLAIPSPTNLGGTTQSPYGPSNDPTAAAGTPPKAAMKVPLPGGSGSNGNGSTPAPAGTTASSAPLSLAPASTVPMHVEDSNTAPPPKNIPQRITARHVLIQWIGIEKSPSSVVRSRDQAYALAQEVLKRARAGDDFARLAVEYSDEIGAAARGGSVGRFGHGQMVTEFEVAAFKLEVGQISGIVESNLGFHIIQRTE